MVHVPPHQSSYHSKEFQLHDSSGHLQAQHSNTSQDRQMQAHHSLDHHSRHTAAHQGPDDEDDLNFHDYIHAKHDDEKDGEESRSAFSSPRPHHALLNGSNRRNNLDTNSLQSDNVINQNNTHQGHQQVPSHDTDSPMNSSDMGQLYDSSSHHYPPSDLVPPPTQDLFRTLMEELQTQAAIQRDQFMASSARAESTTDVSEYSINSHHTRSLPRFMMEPLDFLSANYESCLESGLDSHTGSSGHSSEISYQGSFDSVSQGVPSSMTVSMAPLTSMVPNGSSMSIASNGQSESIITSGPSGTPNSKKRQMEDDSHMFGSNNGTTTPPNISTGHEESSPPTQDLFRMLMEELEAQAALQRDRVLASTSKPEVSGVGTTMNSTDFSFGDNSQQNQQQMRLPRFVMDPFDFLSPNYGQMQVDQSTSQQMEQPRQDVFMNSGPSSDNHQTKSASSSPLLTSHEQQFSPPNQNLFRTLMEELETQAAFQRDQVLAETTGAAARVDPEEYVFNGQHLRPLPRFMFEPLDFLSSSYDSCFGGDMQSNDPPSHHFVQPLLMGLDAMQAPTTTGKQDNPNTQITRRGSQTNKYKAILPQRPKPLTILTSDRAQVDGTSAVLTESINPLKKRRLGTEEGTLTSGSSASCLTNRAPSPLGPGAREGQDSPISPTSMSTLSISPPNSAASPEGSIEGAAAAKRPWTPEDEALLLKLFSKRTPIKEIAQMLDRTVHSVRSRRQILTDPGFVKGKGHGVSRRCKQDPATSTKLPTYAQMAFLSLAWLPDLEGTLNDVAIMVEKLFSRHLNRIPRTGHKNLQIWRAQISDALAHEKGQPRPRFESFGLKRGRQWVYRLTDFGKGIVDAMGGVDAICQNLLRCNEMGLAAAAAAAAASPDDDSSSGSGAVSRDADGQLGDTGADAGIGKGEGYGYSYRPPDARKKSGKRSRHSRKSAARKKEEELLNGKSENQSDGGAANAIANAMEAMAAGLAKMMALENEKAAAN
ncbi:hypothetical protein BGX27_000764 [Mortierella sp. AM989]|nr:hypothetical protein BGX27_000764 [Mortierella sp. AM989]